MTIPFWTPGLSESFKQYEADKAKAESLRIQKKIKDHEDKKRKEQEDKTKEEIKKVHENKFTGGLDIL
jgi:hypothetical protein